MHTPEDLNRRITAITAMSPLARQTMESESYRLTLEDQDVVDDRQIYETLLMNLVDDFYELGVEFLCSAQTLYESDYIVDQLLPVFEHLMPATLYRRLQTTPTLKTVLANILDGNRDTGDSTAVAWVKFLGLEDAVLAEECGEGAEHLMPHIQSTPVFDTVLRNLLALDPTVAGRPDVAQTSDFHSYLARLEGSMLAGLAALEARDAAFGTSATVRRRIFLYIQALSAPDRLAENAWLFLPPPSVEASIAQQTLRLAKLREFTAGSRMHLEYYRANAQPLDAAAVVAIALRLSAASATNEAFQAAVAELRQTVARDELTLEPEINNTLTAVVAHLLTLRTTQANGGPLT